MQILERFNFRTALFLSSLMASASTALADFGGPIPNIAGTPEAVGEQAIRDKIVSALTFVLNFLALLAVIFIVVAGIRLIVSQGEQDAKDKAKKTIIYVIIGLLVIVFARVIVGFFTTTVAAI
jgi:hypothetical protein